MTTPPPQSSFRAIRAGIRRWMLGTADVRATDEFDRALTARMDRMARLLRTARPHPPAELETADFLAEIYDRATRGSANAIGSSLLRRAFTPIATPRDVTWIEPVEASDVVELLREAPRFEASPGRDRPRLARQPGSPARRRVLASAAAIVVGIGAFVVFSGTSQSPELVFQSSDAPLSHDNCAVFVLDVAAR